MASDLTFVEYVMDQLGEEHGATFKHMFSEFGIFRDGKMFALVCDNRLLIKPTEGGRAFIGDVVEAPPYPGAKNCFLIEDRLEDTAWLQELATITVDELPLPKKRKKKKKGSTPKA